MYSKLQKRVKGCTIPILADNMKKHHKCGATVSGNSLLQSAPGSAEKESVR
jgi:hypothetical protein